MVLRVRVELADPGAARKVIEGKVAAEIRRRMERDGKWMAERATELMGRAWDLNRPFERRRSPGTRRAKTAIDYQIEGSTDALPMTLRYRILGGTEVFNRIVILNWGRGDSTIRPSGNWPLAGRGRQNYVAFRRGISAAGIPTRLAWPDVEKFPTQATSPGHAGAGFLEQAAEEAVDRMKSG